MHIKLVNRARSYLSGGKRSTSIHSDLPSTLKVELIKQIDAESDAKINALTNVEFLRLLERVLGDSLHRAMGE